MIQEQLNILEAFILKYNKYFTESFSDVSLSPYTGYIMSGENPVFPNDTLGNYFYLRIPDFTQFSYDKQDMQQEGINPIGLKMPVVLVACVRTAKADVLLENLITTITHYLPDSIKFTKCTYQKDEAIAQEMAKLPVEAIKDALKKVDMDYTIVSISFIISSPYTIKQLACIKSPMV